MIQYLFHGKLPWSSLKIENITEKYNKIKEIKQWELKKMNDSNDSNDSNVINIIMNYCYQLKFKEKPNYDILISLINKTLKNNFNTNDEVLEWNI